MREGSGKASHDKVTFEPKAESLEAGSQWVQELLLAPIAHTGAHPADAS